MKWSSVLEKSLILFLCGYLAILPGCSKSDNPISGSDIPPAVPAFAEIMSTDLSLFQTSNKVAGDTRKAIGWAFITVALTNAFVILASGLPVVATAATANTTPTLESDGKFHWVLEDIDGAGGWKFELTAKVSASTVEWEMYVTNNLLSNFLWFDGETITGEEKGNLQFYNPAATNRGDKLVLVEWDYGSETEKDLTFTSNSDDGDVPANDVLRYNVSGDDITMSYEKSNGNTVEISWDRVTGAGYYQATTVSNGERLCWDENQNDTICPTE